MYRKSGIFARLACVKKIFGLFSLMLFLFVSDAFAITVTPGGPTTPNVYLFFNAGSATTGTCETGNDTNALLKAGDYGAINVTGRSIAIGSSYPLPAWDARTCAISSGNKIFKGWSTSTNSTTGITSLTVFPTSSTRYYPAWATPKCSATNGSCSITTPSDNAPRATITCNSGYNQTGIGGDPTSFTVTGSVGATSVSGTCLNITKTRNSIKKTGGSGTCKINTQEQALEADDYDVFICENGTSVTLPSYGKGCQISNGEKIFVGWSTSATATTGATTITCPITNTSYYAVWATPKCTASHGSCSIISATENAPRATITCNNGYSRSGGSDTISSFIALGTPGATSVSGTCSAMTYTVSFNLNGSNGTAPGNVTATYDSDMPTLSSYTAPTCTGWYSFVGWYDTNATTGGTKYYNADGTSAHKWNKTTNTTLYARCLPRPSIERITWRPNPDDKTTKPTGYYVYAYISAPSGTTIAKVQMPTWTNYNGQDDIQASWQTSSAAAATAGSWTIDGQTYNYRYLVNFSAHGNQFPTTSGATSSGQYSTHVYAYTNQDVYTSKNVGDIYFVTLTLNKNGGSGAIDSNHSIVTIAGDSYQYCPNNTTCQLPAYSGLIKSNSTVSGWNTNSGGTGTNYTTSGVFTANTTLYAKWTTCTACTKGTGVASCSLSVSNNACSYSATCSTGYKSATCTTAGACSCSPIVATVTLNRNYTSTDTTLLSGTYYQKYATGWYPNAELNGTVTYITGNPTRTDYTFVGYYTARSGGTRITDNNSKILTNTAFTTDGASSANTAYAQWCQNCAAVANGSCSLSVADGTCKYTTSCNSSGYTLSGNGTATPTCTPNSYTCTAGNYLAKNATSCSACPAGKYCTGGTYTFSTTADQGITGNVNGGYYSNGGGTSATPTAAGNGCLTGKTCGKCAAGTYSAAGASSCTGCTGRTKWSAAGASSCSDVSSGYYTTGCNTSNNNCTGQSQCTGATYCSGGVQSNCPTGYTADTSNGKTANTQCKISVAGGKYIAVKNESAASGTCAAGTAKAAHTVNYGSTSSCDACSGATQYQNATGQSSCKNVDKGYYKSNNSTQAQCPANYRDGDGASAQSGCKAHCTGGTRVASANAACTGTAGTYIAAHYVNYGSTSAAASNCSNKPANTAYTGYAETNACAWSCNAGYVGSSANGNTSCTACPAGKYCTGGTNQTNCPTGTYRSSTGGTAVGSCSACSNATQYQNLEGQTSCKNVDKGYYKSSNSAQTQCPAGYRDGNGASAQSGCAMSVAGGKYVAVKNESAASGTCAAGTAKAAHTVNYGSTSSCDACTGRTKWSAAGASSCSDVSNGYYTTGCNTSNNNCTGQSQCTGTTYCEGGVSKACPDANTYKRTTFPTHYYNPVFESTGLMSANGRSAITQCQALSWYDPGDRVGLYEYVNYNSTSGKYDTVSSWAYDAVKPGYFLTTKSGCGANAYYKDVKQCEAGSYCPGKSKVACNSSNSATVHTTNFGMESCPSGYPNSVAGAAAITSCYSNDKSRAWTGSQVNGATPTNCASVTEWNACSIAACTYTAYSNSAGTGDGSVKTGCSTNNENCTKTVKAVTANKNYYVNGTACSACSGVASGAYPLSDGGNIGSGYCYASKTKTGSQVNGATPTNCASVTEWNACTPGTCTWKDYYTATDTTCTPTNCTKTVKSVTASAKHYVSGTTCPACSDLGGGFYPNSAEGNTGGTGACYTDSLSGKYIASANATSATNCPAGTAKGAHTVTYGGTSSCTTCAAGTYNTTTGNSSCTTCPAGKYCTGGQNNTACANWTWRSGTGGKAASDCTACPTATSGWTKATGTGWTSRDSCVQSQTPANCASGSVKQTASSDTTWGATTLVTQLKSNAGYYASSTATSCTVCPAGSYCAANATSATACAIGSYTNGTGKSACTACTNGTTTSGTGKTSCDATCSNNTTNVNSWKDASWSANSVTNLCAINQCKNATFLNSNACSACPTADNGWTQGTGTGWTSATSCFETKNVGGNCSAGQLKKNATSATAWSTTATISVALQANAGSYVNGQTCTQCSGATYSAGGAKTSCDSCPSAEDGWTQGTGTGWSTVTQCTETTTPSVSGSPIATICTAGTLTKKATNTTTWGTATASGLTAKAGRYVNGTTCSACAPGTYTASASTATSCTPASKGYYVPGTEKTSQTACAAGTYTSSTGQSSCTDAVAGTYTTGCNTSSTACTGTSVCDNNTWSNSKASICTACTTAKGYVNSGSAAAAHSGLESCKVICSGGSYVATAGAGCVNVTPGYWSAGGTANEKDGTVARTACDSGLTTIGYGPGADEAGDCGRVLHTGDGTLYLRSDRKSSPSLNVKVGNKTFYGNMSETANGKLKVNKDGKTYSVIDDSM